MAEAVSPSVNPAKEPIRAEPRRGTPKWTIYAFESVAVIALAVAATTFFQPPSPSPLIVTGDTTFVATAGQLQTPIALTLPDESTADAASSIAFVFPKDGPFIVSPATVPAAIGAAAGPTATPIAQPGARTATLHLLEPTEAVPVGAYPAAVAVMGSAKRQITANVTLGPAGPVLVILLGLLLSTGVSLFLGVIGPGKQIEADAYRLGSQIDDLTASR